ncbi:hypothetical protein Hanom_Chr11g00995671 [Helianthus anomalus]
MFEEMENNELVRINEWFEEVWSLKYEDKKNIYVKRFEPFLCKKNESLNQLKNRYDELLDNLKEFKIRKLNPEQISKFAEALPLEWDDFLIELKKDSSFQVFIYVSLSISFKNMIAKLIRKRKI